MSSPRSFLEISAASLKHNLMVFRSRIPPTCKLMAIIKGNAWGAGTHNCANVFAESGADWFGVTTIEDALNLRRHYGLPILLLSSIPIDQIDKLIGRNIDLTIASLNDGREIVAAARRLNIKTNIQIKVNTGLNRLGVSPDAVLPLLQDLLSNDLITVTGIFSHFSCADDTGQSNVTLAEMDQLRDVVRKARHVTGWDGMEHMANTAAALSLPESHMDMVRVSIGLMGLNADHPFGQAAGISQVYSWKTSVVYIQDVKKGTRVGYGGNYVCPVDTTLVTIPVGWGDGLPRAYAKGGQILIKGKKYPVVASSMELSTIDLGQRSNEISIGDEVIVFGRQGQENIEPMEHCAMLGLDGAAILTLISERIPRVLV